MTASDDARRIGGKLSNLQRLVLNRMARANKLSGDELVRTAKILIPTGGDVHGDGSERDKITGTANADGSYLADFGPKSKVIEGERGPRPFVNPALAVTRKKHGARSRSAVNRAVKDAMGNG